MTRCKQDPKAGSSHHRWGWPICKLGLGAAQLLRVSAWRGATTFSFTMRTCTDAHIGDHRGFILYFDFKRFPETIPADDGRVLTWFTPAFPLGLDCCRARGGRRGSRRGGGGCEQGGFRPPQAPPPKKNAPSLTLPSMARTARQGGRAAPLRRDLGS